MAVRWDSTDLREWAASKVGQPGTKGAVDRGTQQTSDYGKILISGLVVALPLFVSVLSLRERSRARGR